MKRLVGFVGGFAVVAVACAGSARSSRTGSTGSTGTPVAANAAEAGGATASAMANGAQGATSSGAGAKREVQGRVELIGRDNELTLAGTESAGHAFDKLKLDDDTQVTVNGRKATGADVEEGDDVRASFSQQDGELHLDRVDVVSPSNE